MGTRFELQTLLETLLGSRNVYFQPPESIKIAYPCIIYRRIAISARYASNILYLHKKKYQLTIIDRNPENAILDEMIRLPLCSFQRGFTVDNLNHDVYNLFY